MGELVPEECAPHSGRILVMGTAKPAEMEAQPWAIQRKGKCALQAIMGYVRSTMEYSFLVPRVLVGRKGAPSRQPGQGTRWGGDR